jgi:hypothetical protein
MQPPQLVRRFGPAFLEVRKRLVELWRQPCRHLGRGAVSTVALLLTLAACQSIPDSTSPEFAQSKLPRVLAVTGSGTGTGTVSAPAYGETPAMSCLITNGTLGPENCSMSYGWKTQVQVTATPASGSTFAGWSGACNGTAPTCKVVMTQSRDVRATFTGSGTPSFVLNVSGAGNGNGSITSQQNLSPAIACTITASAGSGTCSGTYPQGTSVTLTAAAVNGHTFIGWSGDCSGTAPCTLIMSASHAAGARFDAPPGPEATVGTWTAPLFNPVIGLHVSNLPSGKFLMWGGARDPRVFDPVAGSFTMNVDNTCTNPTTCQTFCSGHTWLSDGRLLVAGGQNDALGNDNGLNQASIFDGTTWSPTGYMKYARWYPTLVTLSDGNVVALSGNQFPGSVATIPERYNGSTWVELTGAPQTLRLYPRAFLEPKNGYVFYAGEDQPSRYLNPNGTGSWTTVANRTVFDRSYAPAVMLDTKVLYIGGGGGGNCPTDPPPEKTAEILDLAAASPTWSQVAPMVFRRRHHNAVILPDGTVLVTGGTSACGFTNETGAVFAAELWNPNPAPLGTWTTMANASVVRVYHSTASLLPDGRVISTGSGDGGGVQQQNSYEIFSPPYLFKGPRPTYGLSAGPLHYGQAFTITTSNAASIVKVTLIRLASTTHAFDQGQRLNTLSFQAAGDGQSLTVTPPANARLAPPGPYMLFIVSNQGVPSVGQNVLLGP